jgi:hypothetical protein
MNARDYDPSVGRWTSKDMSRFGGGLNFYAYCYGDPVTFADPTGYRPVVDRYLSATGAAWDALTDISEIEAQERASVERGGYIYRNNDGSYSYTRPVAGTKSGIAFPSPLTACPSEGFPVGRYHNHLPGHLHGPSPTDIDHAYAQEFFFGEFKGYISGPIGEFIGYDRTGRTFSIPGVFSPYSGSP